MKTTTITPLTLSAFAAALMMGAYTAEAAPLTPLRPNAENVRTVELTGFGQVAEVTRAREPGATSVRFDAEEVVLGRDTLMVFEVRSERTDSHLQRWRCVAVESTQECFDGPRRFTWQDADSRMVLSIVTENRRTPQGAKLFAEAMRQRDNRALAQD